MAKDLAIALVDGGMMSAVAACLAAQRHRLVTLTLDPSAGLEPGMPQPVSGGSTAGGVGGGAGRSRRRAAVELLNAHLKPYREHTLPTGFMNWVRRSGPSATAGVDPRTVGDLGPKLVELLPVVAIATRFAAHYGAVAVYLGLRVGTDAGELTRATEYLQIWNELIQMPCGLGGSGTTSGVEVQMPLLELELWQVVDLGVQVGCPFERTWSCEQDHAEPCGVCVGCRTREQAFAQAARADPLRRRAG